jgi:hypothetical protein
MMLLATVAAMLTAVPLGAGAEPVELSAVAVESPRDVARPPFVFGREDAEFLEEIQRGAFNFLWEGGVAPHGMVPDRTSTSVVSVAGVGFQLSAICVGAERGWITREEGIERCVKILKALSSAPDNRKAGLFYHFVAGETAGQPKQAYERVVSTIDSAILFAGVLTASQYFGGEVRAIGDALFEDADWASFRAGGEAPEYARGFVSLGWKPKDVAAPTGEGSLLPYYWADSGCEHRLVTFLGVCAPREERRLDPATYYRLRRMVGSYNGAPPLVWFPYSGALFVNVFSHCWIDYSAMGLDDPAAHGVDRRARVDWWENSRRAVRLHREKAIAAAGERPTLGANAWGLTASDVASGYAVPGVFPTRIAVKGERAELDYSTFVAKDDLGDGTLAPYGAGCAIMFEPSLAIAAMRHYRELSRTAPLSKLWGDPARGGYGFADSFHATNGWVASDVLAIDQGPLLLAIENARTGLLWRVFADHPAVKAGMDRLGLRRENRPGSGSERR